MVDFLIILGLCIVSIFVVKIRISYEEKVTSVRQVFLLSLSEFQDLQSLNFEVQTDRKKIKQWDNQHKIDYVIINNKNRIIYTLKLYYNFVDWWEIHQEEVIKKAYSKVSNIADEMLILGQIFKRRCKKEIEELATQYNPEHFRYSLKTFTHHSTTSHYNAKTGSWWYDDSPDETTFHQQLTPKEIFMRVQVLSKYNFEMTEYQYNCDNQRKLMTLELREKIIERDRAICQICQKRCERAEIEIDHIQPVSKGGKTIPSNLQVLCVTCNRKKSNKWLDDASVQNDISQSKISIIEPENEMWKPFEKRYNEIKYNNLKSAEQCAQIGNLITIEYISGNKQLTFWLSDNQNDSEISTVFASIPTISASAPIGKAVLGQAIGDIVDVLTPSGIKQIKIVEIKKQKAESVTSIVDQLSIK